MLLSISIVMCTTCMTLSTSCHTYICTYTCKHMLVNIIMVIPECKKKQDPASSMQFTLYEVY